MTPPSDASVDGPSGSGHTERPAAPPLAPLHDAPRAYPAAALLRETLAAVVELQGARMGAIRLVDPALGDLHAVTSIGLGDEYLALAGRVGPGDGPCGVALQLGRSVIVSDVETSPICRTHLHAARLAGYRAVHSAVLRASSGDVLGTMCTYFDIVHEPSPRDRQMVELCAHQVARALEHERLLEAELVARETAQAERDQAAFLAAVSAILASSLDYATTLQQAARCAVPAFADYCVVDLLDASGDIRRLAEAHEDPAMEAVLHGTQRHYPLGAAGAHHPLRAVAHSDRARLVADVSDTWMRSAARSEEHLADIRRLAPRSLVIAPLRARGNALGVMTFVRSHSGLRYTERDVALAEQVAYRAATAIDASRLYRAAQLARAEFETASDQLAEQAARLQSTNEQLRRQAAELESQARALQITADALARRTEEAERARDTAECAEERTARLQAVSNALAGMLTPAQVAAVVVGEGLSTLGAAAGVLMSLAPDGQSLELVHAAGFSVDVARRWRRIPLDAPTTVAEAVRRGEPLVRAEEIAGEPCTVTVVPLMSDDHAMGALAFTYPATRAFDAEEQAFVRLLSSQCALALARAQLYEAERSARERLRLATEAAGVGTWDLDVGTGELVWDAHCRAAFGLPPEARVVNYDVFLRCLSPADRERVHGVVQAALDPRGTGELDIEFLTLGPDGRQRWIHATWRALFTIDDGAGGHRRAVRLVGTVLDVTDRRWAEAALRDGEARYRSLVEATAAIVWSTPPSGEFASEQPGWTAFTGQSFDSLAGNGWIRAVHPEDRAHTMRAWTAALESRSLYAVEHRLRRHDGVYRHMQVRAVPVLGADGAVREWVGLHDDVTEQRAAEQASLERERQFRVLAESIPQLAWMADASGSIFWFNQRWYDFTGLTLDETRGARGQALIHPDHVHRVAAYFQRTVHSGAVWEDVFPIRGTDGRYRWFLSRALPIRDADGRVVRWFGTNTDITEQQEAQEALRERQERLGAALHASGTGTFRWEFASDALELDESLDRLFGLPPGETMRSLPDFLQRVHPGDRARVTAACERCALHGVDFDEEFRVLWPDGTVRWLDDKASTFFGDDGRPTYMTGACVDVTERHALLERERRARADAEAAREAAEAANRTKSEFLAVMSHELRTPLNAIAGYAQLMQLGVPEPVTAAHQEYLARIQQSQRHLLGLINSVLNYARIEAGRMSYDLRELAVGELLGAIEPLVQPQLAAKALGFRCPSCDSGLAVTADAEKVSQILLNLVSNAVKFTPPGGRIALSAEPVADGAGVAPRVAIRVHDTGVGIAADKLESIFDPFVQVDSKLTRQTAGTGLGLAISRDLARGMNGDLTVQSVPGAGSTFTLLLPRAGEGRV